MRYILKASPKAFIIAQPNNELIITSDYTKATQYNTIGDAMRAASEVNEALGVHVFKAESIG